MKVEDFLAGKYLLRPMCPDTPRPGFLVLHDPVGDDFAVLACGTRLHVADAGGRHQQYVRHRGRYERRRADNLRDYINDKSEFVAIERLKQPWWDEEKQNRIRGLLLDNIKSEYNYWAIVRVIRNIWFGSQRSVRGRRQTIAQFEIAIGAGRTSSICSGVVQFGFVEGISEYVLARKLPPWALKRRGIRPGCRKASDRKGRWEKLKAKHETCRLRGADRRE